jgi:hypothetical protein
MLILSFIIGTESFAQDQATIETVARKCDENTQLLKSLEKSQQEILRQLKEMREELNVVKIRATR